MIIFHDINFDKNCQFDRLILKKSFGFMFNILWIYFTAKYFYSPTCVCVIFDIPLTACSKEMVHTIEIK